MAIFKGQFIKCSFLRVDCPFFTGAKTKGRPLSRGAGSTRPEITEYFRGSNISGHFFLFGGEGGGQIGK